VEKYQTLARIVNYIDEVHINKLKVLLRISLLNSRNKNQFFKVWLIKLLEKESNNSDSLSEYVNINSTFIEEISNSSPSKKKGKENFNLDFPLEL